jgi:hypothetical protein
MNNVNDIKIGNHMVKFIRSLDINDYEILPEALNFLGKLIDNRSDYNVNEDDLDWLKSRIDGNLNANFLDICQLWSEENYEYEK